MINRIKKIYSRRIGTAWVKVEEIMDIAVKVREYLEKKHYCKIGNATFEKKFKIEDENKYTQGRIGVTIMNHNDDPYVTYHRFQIIPSTPSDSPLHLDYRIELRIGNTRRGKSSVDKLVSKILGLHPLLKEQKKDNVIIY